MTAGSLFFAFRALSAVVLLGGLVSFVMYRSDAARVRTE